MNRAQLTGLYRMYDPDAEFWSLDEVRRMVAQEYPEWPGEEVDSTALRVFHGLCRLDAVRYNSQRRFGRLAELCRNPLCPQATTAAEEDALLELG